MTKGTDLKVGQEVYRAAVPYNYSDKPRMPQLAIATVVKVTPKTLRLSTDARGSDGFGYRTMFPVTVDYYTDKAECVQDAIDRALEDIANSQRLHREWTRILVNLK